MSFCFFTNLVPHISPTTGQFGESMKEHTGTIRVVKFLSEGSGAAAALLASAGAGDCKPRLWDAQTGKGVVKQPSV